MLKVWKEVLTVIEGLLIPPLSKLSSDMKPLTDKEVDIVFKWLKVLFVNSVLGYFLNESAVHEGLLSCGRRRRLAGIPSEPKIS